MSNKRKSREEIFKPKLTEQQRREIFSEYVKLHTKNEQRAYAPLKAKELGVSDDTVRRVLNDQKRWDAYLKAVDNIKNREIARAYAHLGDALDVSLGVIRDKEKYEGSGLIQYPMQAATDLMNRLGLKAEAKESDGVNITFVGGCIPATNMPERKGEPE